MAAVCTAWLSSLTTGGQAAESQGVQSRTPAMVRSLRPVDRFAGTNQLNLAIGLPLRNREALTNLLRQIYDPASPNYHHFLTPEQFTERFGPAEKDYQAVIAFAKAHGLKVTTTHPNRMLVDVSASVAEVEQAMHVRFQVYQHPTEKRLFHAPDTEPSLDLPVPVLGISGLNDYSQPRPRLQARPLTSATGFSLNTGSGPNGAYLGKDFRAAYAADTTLDGSGQVVGLLQFDGYTASDIAYYESFAGLPSITLSNVLVDGATGLPTGNELEVSLDIEMAVSMATNLSKVVVYMTPNPSPWEDILNRMANDNVAKQLSCSWYEIDGASNAVADQIFQQMAAQGQSFFAASGDADAYTGLIPFPCDTPYITVVGGTTLTTSGPGGAWQSETVWNRGSGVGTGGGISTQFPIPSWQTNISMMANQGSTTMRNIPDVALTAENVYVRTDGKDYLVGGTSCATPLWAGFAALANQQAAASDLPALGFINPALVAIGNGTYYATVFHDIVTGNNISTTSPDKFHAVPGYDLCTGWGTPNGQMMIDALADPQLLALVITPASGFNFIGPVGGPFAAPAQSFSLTDIGSAPLNWALANTSLWLNVSSSSGTLAAGAPATMITVSLNSTASNLPVGIYHATLFFTNLDGGIAQSRQFALNIGELPLITAEPTNRTAEWDGATTLSATISSIGPFTCQWQLNGTNLPNNLITTMAGNGGTGFSGDGGQATNASLDNPYGVAVDDTGDLFIADANNNRIREVNSFGTITTVAGNGIPDYSGDGGLAASAGIDDPIGVAVDSIGNLFIADADNNRIRKVDTYGTITTVAGNGNADYAGDGGPATNAALSYPYGVAVDGAGNLFIADLGNNRIRKVDTNGIISTVAGNGTVGYSGDGSLATNAALADPYGVAVDGTGHLFIADLGNNRIRKVDPLGLISTVAGNGTAGYSGDGGLAINAACSAPAGVAVDVAGNLFIADSGNNRIREVGTNGIIFTVVGNGTAGHSGDDGQATNAVLSYPIGVAVDSGGNLFIADSGNDRIRKVMSTQYPTLILDNLTIFDQGNYAIIISNAWGCATSSVANLTVLSPPVIASQPQSLSATNGGIAAFSITTLGTAPLSYQWQKDGLNLSDGGELSGSLTTNLVLSAATISDSGDYTVIITNDWGSVTSSVATLAVGFPPAITSQPQSLTTTNGSTADFSVTVSGTAPLGCQWQLNGLNLTDGDEISGSATTNLVLSAATMSGAGNYTVIITNDWGCVTSTVATLAVVSPPVITQPPASLIVGVGGTASFNVTAWGTAPLGYQWQLNGMNLTDGGEISGSSTTNLVLSAATLSDAGNYTVIITNAWGSITSSVATLTVVFPPVITSQPQSQIVTNGSSALLSVTASGVAPLNYQWQKNGLNLADSGNLSGSAAANLIVSVSTTNDAGNYLVIVTNAWGSATSSVAILTVVSPPVITQQPTNQVVVAGSAASFNVTASGSAPLGYQWQLDSTNVTDGGELSGSDTTNLVLNATTTNDVGSYTVIITNAWGSVTSSVAILTVVFPPVITSQPQSLTVLVGSPAALNVTVSGTAPLNFQWLKNGMPLLNGSELSGLASPNLVFNATTIGDMGSYAIVVTNTWGSVTSSVAILTVISPPVIAQQPANQIVVVGSPASFNVTAWGTAPLGYQWQINGTNLTDGGELSGSDTTNLVLSDTITNDAGSYTVIITNAWGSVTSSVATLAVGFPPTITSPPQSLTVPIGSPATFNVTVSGTTPLGCQWLKNGMALTDGGELSGSATPNLVLSASTMGDLGSYAIVVTNAWGSVTSSVTTLTVVFPPAITSQPQSLTVPIGSPAAFNATVSGTMPLGCQWLKNGFALTDGGELSGSSSTNLVFSATTMGDLGSYAIVVSNAWGSVTSSVATLTVVSPPVIAQQSTNQTVVVGSAASFNVAAWGTPPLGYQWQTNGTNLTDGGEISGSETTNLVLSDTTTNDVGSFTVVITNAWGSVTSSVATLTVVFPPAITSQPQSLTVPIGSPATFNVTVSGTTPLGCQWLKNGMALTDGGELSGSATPNLVLSASTMGDLGSYAIVVTNAWGSITSSIAILTVISPPLIAQQPTNQIVVVGSAASFSVAAWGTPSLGYQWQINGTNLTDGGELSGSSTTNLVLSATTTNDVGSYTVIITNAWGSVTSSAATLTIVFPPAITSQPQSLTVPIGSPAAFNVMASGTTPLGCQWLKNGMALTDGGELSGSATPNLVWSATTMGDLGSYAIVVTNAWGSITSSVAILTVISPPVVAQQPTNQIVVVGSAASFSVVAWGTPSLGYQWQINGTNLTDGGELSGSSTTNLVLSNTTTNDVGSYTVIITNAWGSATSSVATLTVVFPPTITSQPQSLTVPIGSPAAFNVTVSGTTPFGCQWLKNGMALTDGGELSGSATPNLVLSASTLGDLGSYAIVVTNAWGSVTSGVAILTVISPPVIAQQPTNQLVVVGSAASFTVAAWGTPPLGYQWQINGTNLTDAGELSGSETTNLVLGATTTNDVGSYTVIITNAWGSVTSSVATLTVVFPPTITSQPQSLTVPIGGPAAFNVTVSGTTPLGCQWLKDGMVLTDGGELSGSATTNLVLSGTMMNDGGNYAIVVTNAWGSVTSGVATLTVISPPVIAQQPTNQLVVVGSAASFTVAAWGTAPMGYQWQFNRTNLNNGGEFSGSATTNLVLSDITTNDVGDYTVIITNAWGSVTSSVAALTVAFPPVITDQPQSVTVINGTSTGFSVSVSGTAPLEYQWQKDGVDLANGGQLSGSITTNILLSITTNLMLSATTNLALSDATPANAGNYTVIISNAWGSVTSHVAALTIVFPPSITSQPQNLTATNGGPAGLSVLASGTAPLGYQWQKDGMNLTDGGLLSGSTTTNLLLSAISTNDAGNYTVIVTNAWGSVTSSAATLAVGSQPLITSQPQSLTVTNGRPANFSVAVSGSAPLGYQWQENGLPLADGGGLSGSSTTNLVLSAATISSSGNYTVIITNAWGSVTSSVASLAVGFPPAINSQPQSLTVTNGRPANFSVAAAGSAPLRCQWRKNGINLADGGALSGSATTNLMLSTTSTNDAGTYAIIVTNAWGNVTSSVANLTVLSPPAIARQPTNLAVAVGGSASFNVTASGVPPVGYQWNFNGTNISGATNTSLVLSNVQPSQAGVYTVWVTNSLGSVLSSNAVLTVTPDHFSWGQIAATRFVNTPFAVTLQARNLTNGIFTNFTGTVFLDSSNGVAVSPTVSGNFVQGSWTGTVVVAQPITNLVLRANDGLGHLGLANSINVLALPPLTLRISGNTLQFLWPATYNGFQLEGSGSVSPANWNVISASPIQLGNQFLVPLQLPGTNCFYRLRYNGS